MCAMGLTRAIAAFVSDLDAAAIPAAALSTVRRGMADCVGVSFAGAHEAVAGHALALAQARSSQGPSRIWTRDAAASPADAALANATIAHALDFDDTGLEGHPSVVLAPVVLAEAQRLGRTWREAVVAYVIGYETWAELLARDEDKHHGKGWHPTAVFGVVAGAAAAARMRGLDAQASAHALGIAASMAAGLVANFGSTTKPLQVGFAAANAVVAVTLAERGATAARDALESPRGFLRALSPAGRVRRDGECRIGQDWQIVRQGLNIKRYPVCYAAHRIVDAALALRGRLHGRMHDIVEATVRMGELQAAMLRSQRPRSALDAKFSAQYVVACALLRGRLTLQDLSDEAVLAEDVQQLLRRVRVVPLSARDEHEPLFSPEDRLSVRLRDGACIDGEPVRRALGHASRPVGDGELAEKFLTCARVMLDDETAQAWWRSVSAPDDCPVRWPVRPC